MTTASLSTMDNSAAAEAREELAKFFTIAAALDHMPGMFSRFIDDEWHRLAKTPDYPRFCQQTAGVLVTHDPTCGVGPVTWLNTYHNRYGELPAIWFADETGHIDHTAYATYRNTRTVHASWNCSADTGDPDYTPSDN